MPKRKVKKHYSGPNIPDSQRHTEPTRVHLEPGYRARLDALVRSLGYTSRGDLIEAWIDCEEQENVDGRRYAKKVS